MIRICQMSFKQFLEFKFLEWQQKEGGRKTVAEFAQYIGVSQTTISGWWNQSHSPEGKNLQKLALKLGLEVYDTLGLPRPDADLYYIQKNWDKAGPETRKQIRDQLEKYMTENRENEYKKQRKPRHTG